MKRLAAVPTGSMVSPCCCGCGAYFGVDLDVTIAGILACAGYTFNSGINGPFTALWDAGSGTWIVTVGSVTFGGDTDDAILTLACQADGGFLIIISFLNSLNAHSVYSSGATFAPFDTAAPNVLTGCLTFEAGHDGTVTVIRP